MKRLLGILAMISAVGCGSSDTPGSGGAGGGDGGAGGTGGQGGTSDGGSGGATGGGGAAPSFPSGTIHLESDSPDGFGETYVQAEFHDEASGCVITDLGTCQLVDCRKGTENFASAGKLTVTGGGVPLPVPVAADGSYHFDSTSTSWSPGDALTVKATGDVAPAFTLRGVAPPLMTVTQPSFDDAVVIDRKRDLNLAWKGAAGEVQLVLTLNPELKLRLTCRFDAASGKATVPAATLAKVPLATGDQHWNGQIRDTTVTRATVEDWALELDVDQFGETPAHAASGGPVTVQ